MIPKTDTYIDMNLHNLINPSQHERNKDCSQYLRDLVPMIVPLCIIIVTIILFYKYT